MMNPHLENHNEWTVSFEPQKLGPNRYQATWNAVRPAHGTNEYKIERKRSSGLAEAATLHAAELIAWNDWVAQHGEAENSEGAQFQQYLKINPRHIFVRVYVVRLGHGNPAWKFSAYAFNEKDGRHEVVSSGTFKYSSVEDAFEDANRLLRDRYTDRA